MANGWTLERRRKQAEMIRNWKPWDRSTGPKTAEGKAKVSGNAHKHGGRSKAVLAEIKRVKEAMKELENDEFSFNLWKAFQH